MSTFSPTPQFTKRWLSTPDAIKKAFHQELDDIINMLHGETSTQDFEFTHPDFDNAINQLMLAHKDDDKAPVKFIHGLDTSLTAIAENKPNLDAKDLKILEKQIHDKLATQIDDFLNEHITQLSDDLKAWIKTAIKNELTKYSK